VNLEQRARTILTTLGLSPADVDLQRRIKTFVLCNGYDGVQRAALYTASQAAKETINDPWAYAVQVYNGNLARLCHLYILAHWAECGIRSQVDLHLTNSLGTTWYRFPERYLPQRSVGHFFQDASLRGIGRVPDRQSTTGLRVADFPSAGEFLEQITIGWLTQIALSVHQRNAKAIFVRADGRVTLQTEITTLLEAAKQTRNDVSHHHYLTNEALKDKSSKLLRLLEILRFDTVRAIQRVEAVRRPLVVEVIRELQASPSAAAR